MFDRHQSNGFSLSICVDKICMINVYNNSNGWLCWLEFVYLLAICLREKYGICGMKGIAVKAKCSIYHGLYR